MFTRLGQVESKLGKSGLDFFQTHPSSESRVKVRHRHFHLTFLSLTRHLLHSSSKRLYRRDMQSLQPIPIVSGCEMRCRPSGSLRTH